MVPTSGQARKWRGPPRPPSSGCRGRRPLCHCCARHDYDPLRHRQAAAAAGPLQGGPALLGVGGPHRRPRELVRGLAHHHGDELAGGGSHGGGQRNLPGSVARAQMADVSKRGPHLGQFLGGGEWGGGRRRSGDHAAGHVEDPAADPGPRGGGSPFATPEWGRQQRQRRQQQQQQQPATRHRPSRSCFVVILVVLVAVVGCVVSGQREWEQ